MKQDREKTVLITGCDYGLGVDLVRVGLARGYRVFAGCLKPTRARVVRRLARQHGKRPQILKINMAAESEISGACAIVRKKTKSLDRLINNAGIYWHDGTDRVRFRDFHRMFDVNAFGPAYLIRQLRRLLRAAGSARIINISSEAGSMHTVRKARPVLAYGASKAALNMIGRRMSFELAKDGIRLAMVHPGWMRTPMGFVNGEPGQEPADTAAGIYRLADRLTAKMSGGFFHFDGRRHPW